MKGRIWIGVTLFAAMGMAGCADDAEETSVSASEDRSTERVDGEDEENSEGNGGETPGDAGDTAVVGEVDGTADGEGDTVAVGEVDETAADAGGETVDDDAGGAARDDGDETADDAGGETADNEGAETVGDDDGESAGGDGIETADDEGGETVEEEGERFPDPGSTAENCGAVNLGDGDSGVDCTAYGDTESACVFSNHCLCSEDFVCTEGYEGFEIPAQECAPGATCISKFDFGTSGISCGGALEGQVPVDCTAQGDTGAFCVYGDHCACSEGFICGALDGSEGGGNAGECAYGEVCLPE